MVTDTVAFLNTSLLTPCPASTADGQYEPTIDKCIGHGNLVWMAVLGKDRRMAGEGMMRLSPGPQNYPETP